MQLSDISNYYPSLFHVSAPGSWPTIRKLGLLSTTALLDLFGIKGPFRRSLELDRRGDAVRLDHPEHGVVVLRDQKPLSLTKLRACLQDGLAPEEWLRILNRKVFFWVSDHRVQVLSNAQAYVGERQQVITVDTAALLKRHGDRVLLSPMNSGTTRPMAFPRGRSTFASVQDYDFAGRRRKRGIRNAIAELTVDYSVPDIADLTICVREMGGGAADEVIWER